MDYKKLSEGIKYFSKLDEFSNDEMIDPVYFVNTPSVEKLIYHREFVQENFNMVRRDLVRLAQLRNMNFGDYVEEERQALMDEQNNLEGNLKKTDQDRGFLKPGEARCPITRATINEKDMRTHSQLLLFRNVFIVAARNAILNNKEEYYKNNGPKSKTLRLQEILKTLSAEEVKEAEVTLQKISEGKPTLFSAEQLKLLKDWGVDKEIKRPNENKEKSNLKEDLDDDYDRELQEALDFSLALELERQEKEKIKQEQQSTFTAMRFQPPPTIAKIEDLMSAVQKGDNKSVLELVKKIDPNIPMPNKQSALHIASMRSTPNSAQLVETLVTNGAKTDVTDGLGWTPIQYAIYSENENALKFYIEHKLVTNKDLEFSETHQKGKMSEEIRKAFKIQKKII